MQSRDFCYWLQGFFEIGGTTYMDANQIECVKRHLNLVFLHEIDPSIHGNDPEKKKILNEVHRPPTVVGPDSETFPVALPPTPPPMPVMRC